MNTVQMDTKRVISSLAVFGQKIKNPDAELLAVLHRTEIHNPWFTPAETQRMLNSISENMLNEADLMLWASAYPKPASQKTIGLVLAGNVPFVGMHDLICVLVSGHFAQVKLSSKDMFFFPWLKKELVKLDPVFESQIQFVEKLENFDAVIATGSNNSSRYFEYYFGKYPHIIRKNRTSIAILTGDESDEELYNLGKDVFYYYGLGCRNVGKVFIPENYDKQNLFRLWEDYRYVTENTKYSNNYDYNRALLMLNSTDYLTNDFYMLLDNEQLFSPLSLLYCETYYTKENLAQKIEQISADLQCVVASAPGNTPFGKTQFPGLSDYADHIDTMAFLAEL
ncbi:MAG: acyl-CoA reductase [Bacteroidetes bacterium]|nr:acyl-CoA reductase [Bacteroidota bacterium]